MAVVKFIPARRPQSGGGLRGSILYCKRKDKTWDERTRRQLELQLFRIGSCYIFGTPCQIFVQYGKRMKEACGGFAFISAFANDYCGYVPTPECMVPGVYEARLAPTSALEPAAGDILTEAMLKLYTQIC